MAKRIKKEEVSGKDIHKVTMISYSIKMVIPTGAYANIQPEITVNAGSPEEAEAYIAPHMNKLWKEYFMIGERRISDMVPTSSIKKTEPAPISSVAFTKASQAIASCLGEDFLNLIENQIKKSVKLTDGDKEKLNLLVIGKRDQLLNGR